MGGDAFATTFMPSDKDLTAAEQLLPCHALDARSATIIRLRLYEEAIERADVSIAKEKMINLETSVSRSLQCVPTDAFLWFVRYWMRVNQGEPASLQISNLVMSYKLGPHEGWIAVRRNAYALAVYQFLPTDLQAIVRKEFASLVDAGLLQQALRNLRGSGWPLRDILLSELAWTKLSMRQYFSRMLQAEAIDLTVPGVQRRDHFFWR